MNQSWRIDEWSQDQWVPVYNLLSDEETATRICRSLAYRQQTVCRYVDMTETAFEGHDVVIDYRSSNFAPQLSEIEIFYWPLYWRCPATDESKSLHVNWKECGF